VSGDQKPRGFKLVSSKGRNQGRRRGDRLPVASEVAEGATGEDASAIATAEEPSRSASLLLVVLFLLSCAVGGAGVVFFGLVEGVSG